MEWALEPPKEAGYFLATWKYDGTFRNLQVSELWFDGRLWWSIREYIDGFCYDEQECLGIGLTEEVIAWMPKPKPYRKEK